MSISNFFKRKVKEEIDAKRGYKKRFIKKRRPGVSTEIKKTSRVSNPIVTLFEDCLTEGLE